MARTDRSAFLGVLRDAEREMDVLFRQLAADVGRMVVAAAGPDGMVPEVRIQDLQRQAGRRVDALFVGSLRQPFGEGHEPMAPYPRLISDGQKAMIDIALAREAAILERHLPPELARRLAEETR